MKSRKLILLAGIWALSVLWQLTVIVHTADPDNDSKTKTSFSREQFEKMLIDPYYEYYRGDLMDQREYYALTIYHSEIWYNRLNNLTGGLIILGIVFFFSLFFKDAKAASILSVSLIFIVGIWYLNERKSKERDNLLMQVELLNQSELKVLRRIETGQGDMKRKMDDLGRRMSDLEYDRNQVISITTTY